MQGKPHDDFVGYYARESLSNATRERFLSIQSKVLKLAPRRTLDVLDVGCGAGTQARMWAELGHRVQGVDVNVDLIEIARKRTDGEPRDIRFVVASAARLPFADASMDVCLLPELLEHVGDWEGCLDEAVRVLRPRGVLYLSTTNALCPRQQEFDLPMYSWYPPALKRRYERLAVTSRPELVQHAPYPAVHWFTPYGLARWLKTRGMRCLDRFDMVESSAMSSVRRAVSRGLQRSRVLRFVGHVLTPSTLLFAVKEH
ncbi:MAG TPA: class I SAM-dependent methyltransferase [Casimicrobiaceae bacterium]|nr:class I SAM-dependent methyltransferase [Casimicrobiaceae bacterium]